MQVAAVSEAGVAYPDQRIDMGAIQMRSSAWRMGAWPQWRTKPPANLLVALAGDAALLPMQHNAASQCSIKHNPSAV